MRAVLARQLQDAVAGTVGNAPFEGHAEPRKFIPHVTLARLRGATGRDVAEYLSLRGGFSAEPFPVERFVLFSSRNSVGGGPYVVEEEYPLRPQPEPRGWDGHGSATWA